MDGTQKDEKGVLEQNAKKKLDNVLESAADKGERLAQIGREQTSEGQTMTDIANAICKVLRFTSHLPDIENSIAQWEASNQQADLVIGRAEKILLSPMISGSISAAITSANIIWEPKVYLGVSEENRPLLSNAITNLSGLISRPVYQQEVAKLMQSLGLDKPQPREKSPLEQFTTAHEAFVKPATNSNPINTSLVPMRESIRSTIVFLIKHRPKQVKTKNEWEKILSIGNQLAFDSISPEQISTWASIWDSLDNELLSPSKTADFSREEWQSRLVKSTLFLKSFLFGIDPAKLRR